MPQQSPAGHATNKLQLLARHALDSRTDLYRFPNANHDLIKRLRLRLARWNLRR